MERARVESRYDPKGLGRVKIRIPGLHGSDASVDSLPWAFILSQGGGYDSGDFKPPEVGSFVLVDKSPQEEQYYVLGVIRGVGNKSQRGSFYPEDDKRYPNQLIGKWMTDGTPEVPSESQNTGEPATITVYKTLKGATIKISDIDGDENIEIIGHDGSTIKMISPKLPDYYKGRGNTRLKRDMNNPVPLSELSTTAMVMKDSSGNIIRTMGNRDGKSTVEVIGKGSNGVAGVEILPDDNKMSLFTSSGGERSEVSITNSSVSITNGKSSFVLSGESVSIDCSHLVIKSSNVDVSGNNMNLKSNSASITGSSIEIGGGSTSIGPQVGLGAPIVPKTVDSPTPRSTGDWSNNVESKYGGDSK